MKTEVQFIIFWIIIVIPFFCGSRLKKRLSDPNRTARKLIRTNLILLEPLILFWTIWGLNLSRDVIVLPFAGLITVSIGFLLGKSILPFLHLKQKSHDSYLISSILSNQGMTLGGLMCYLIAGEQGLGLASIYIIYYLPFVFVFIFPFARYSSLKQENPEHSRNRITFRDFRSFFFNLQNLPLLGIITALFLQVGGINRPDIYFPLNILLIGAISIYYLTLGINFEIGDVWSYRKEQIALSISKFLILPCLTLTAIHFIDLDKTIETVIIVQSFMPAAIYSVLSSILYDLDSRLNSSLFVLNSLIFLTVILPLLLLFKDVLFT